MTVYQVDKIRKYVGLEADIKPTFLDGSTKYAMSPGSEYLALDTCRLYTYSSDWIFTRQLVSTSS